MVFNTKATGTAAAVRRSKDTGGRSRRNPRYNPANHAAAKKSNVMGNGLLARDGDQVAEALINPLAYSRNLGDFLRRTKRSVGGPVVHDGLGPTGADVRKGGPTLGPRRCLSPTGCGLGLL